MRCSGLAAARELDCVAMNGGGSARPDLSAQAGIGTVIHGLGQGQAGNAASVCFVCVFLCAILFKLRPAGVQSVVWPSG